MLEATSWPEMFFSLSVGFKLPALSTTDEKLSLGSSNISIFLAKNYWWGGGGGGPCDFIDSPSPIGLDFGVWDFRLWTLDLGLTFFFWSNI